MGRKILLILFLLGIINNSFSQTTIDDLLQDLNEVSSVDEERIKILDDLTNAMLKENHPDQIKYLRETVQLAEKLEKYDFAAKKVRFIVQYYLSKGQSDSALGELNHWLKKKSKFKKTSSEGHLLLKRASYYYDNEELNKAVKDYDLAGDLFKESKDSIFMADARFFAGQVYSDLSNFLKSLQRFNEAYTLYYLLGDKEYVNYTLNELSNVYENNGLHKEAILERNKILLDAKKLMNHNAIAYAYSQLATGYLLTNDLEKAKKYTDSMSVSVGLMKNEIRKKQFEVHLNKNYARYYLEKNDLDNAEKYLKITAEKVKATNAPEFYEKSFLLYEAMFYSKKGMYKKAEQSLKKLLKEKQQKGDVNIITEGEREISEVFAKQNNFKNAYIHLLNYVKLEEKHRSRIATNTLLYYQSQFDTHRKSDEIFKKKTEIELLEKDKKIAEANRKSLLGLLISVVVLSTLISCYIWRQGKQKRKALAIKVKRNKEELNEFTKLLLEKSKIQESLTIELKKLKDEIGTQNTIEKIQDLTTTRILTKEDWYSFKEKFVKVYPSFFIDLKNKGYQLTKAEERLLAMEKLYLDKNQIASMLAISQESVTRSRSRLRKKINAPKGCSILEYLETI